jgi:hypothetical protein
VTPLDAIARAVYVVATALVFGGTAALSFAAAPQVFRTLRPAEAGTVFGKVLRVFDAMAQVASTVAVVAAVVGLLESVGPAAIARLVLAACVLLVALVLRRSVAPQMAALKPPANEEEERRWDPEARRRFDRLHKRYVAMYSANLFVSLAALVLATAPV